MYRQEILFDLYEHANLRKGLEQLIPKMQEVTVFARSTNEADSPFQQAVWRLGELELYVECLDELSRLFATDGAGVSAEGLCELRDTVEEERASEAFETLKRELPDMRKGLKNKRSVTIGVNLDQRLRPVEAALLSVNDTPYSEQRLLTGVMKALGGNSDFRVSTPLHRTPMAEEVGLPGSQKIPLSPLFQDLEQLLRSVSRNLLRSLERFMNMHTDILRTLHRDLGFYLGGCRLMERLSQEGLPVSRPRILDPAAAERPDSAGETNHAQTAKHAHVSQFYNIHLARRMMNRQHGAKQVVCNSLSMEDPRRIFILTGPNQGGKTTFVQGLGLLHVLIQSGLFAPAAEAYIRPVDRILTHFPHAEQGSTSTGRFSEELQRLSHMLRHVTGNSLLLLNE